ncbi:MAG: DUF3052 domain-containing protein [Acidobacteriota bacterium]
MAGYSSTPLAKKIGYKEGFEAFVVGAPEGYRQALDPLPPAVRFNTSFDQSTDLVHHFTKDRAELEAALRTYRRRLDPQSMIWISWPKKASKVPTDVTEDVIRAVALPLGFVDIKVCAVDAVWSGLKLVVRKELR